MPRVGTARHSNPPRCSPPFPGSFSWHGANHQTLQDHLQNILRTSTNWCMQLPITTPQDKSTNHVLTLFPCGARYRKCQQLQAWTQWQGSNISRIAAFPFQLPVGDTSIFCKPPAQKICREQAVSQSLIFCKADEPRSTLPYHPSHSLGQRILPKSSDFNHPLRQHSDVDNKRGGLFFCQVKM